MYRKFFLSALALCLIAGLVPLAAPGLAGEPAPQAEKSIVIGLGSDALFLDPHHQDETITNALTSHLYDGLLRNNTEGKPVASLATSWELADDQKTWTFHLRPGVKFSDGSPFSAEDVKFNVERIRDTTTKSAVNGIDRVEVVDDNTVKIITKTPYAVLLDNLARIRLVSKAYVERVGNDEANLKPVGTGPYRCVEWVKEDHITLVPNEHYWGTPPAIKNVRFRPITNAATRTAALLTGEVDFIEDVPVRDIERVERNKGTTVVSHPGARLIYLHIDANRSPTPAIDLPTNPMTDVRVRQAMSLGIDRELIVKVALNGSGYPTGELVLPGKRGYLDGLPVPPCDPEKAKALLKDAGWEKGFKVKLDAPNGRYPNDAQVAQAIASQLAKIGITIDLMLHPKSVFFDYVRPGDKSSLVMTGWSEMIDLGEMANTLFYSRDKTPGKGTSNRAHYSNAEFDRLIDAGDATADVAKRAEYLEEAARVILDDVGVIPLYFNKDNYGKKDKVKFTPRFDKQILAQEMDIVE
ncbi:MAG: ABC transporter substrate-binding protein [Synergistaceae bacterium]|jgi:peptide/nickel transport system substrate-binding protein|nr:ABC transporter substrate-binding protein [Synergistaceae bacterium]